MIRKIIVSAFFGLLILLYSAPYDSWITSAAGIIFKRIFERSYNCTMCYQSCTISFFPLKIELYDMHVFPKTQFTWSWKADCFTLASSWSHLFATGIADLHVAISGLSIRSDTTGTDCAIIPHAQKLFGQAELGLPTMLKEVRCGKSECIIRDTKTHYYVQAHFSGLLKRIANKPNGVLTLERLQLKNERDAMLVEGGGSVCLRNHIDNQQDSTVIVKGEFRTAEASTRYFVSGNWRNNRGYATIHDAYKEITIDPIDITYSDQKPMISASIRGSLSSLLAIAGISNSSVKQSTGTLSAHVHANSEGVSVEARLQDAVVGGYLLCSEMVTQAKINEDMCEGDISLKKGQHAQLEGSWKFVPSTQQFDLNLKNSTTLVHAYLPTYSIAPEQLHINMTVDKNKVSKATVTLKSIDAESLCKTVLSVNSQKIAVEGTFLNDYFDAQITINPIVQLDHCFYRSGLTQNVVLALQRTKQWANRFSGFVDFESLSSVLKPITGYALQATGKVGVYGYTEPQRLTLQLKYDEGTVSIPGLYNCIEQFQARVICDFYKRQVICAPISCSLSRGSIKTERAIIDYGYKDGFSVHVPVIVSDCWFNIEQNVFCALSGQLLITAQAQKLPLISGTVILDHVQLTDNLFSTVFQNNLSQSVRRLFARPFMEIGCDIALYNRNPIRIATPFLSAHAQLQAKIEQSVHDPRISGYIDLLEGQITFPYCPLFITKGQLHLMPKTGIRSEQYIDLYATNTVAGHDIVLQVQGSHEKHDLQLYSYPYLRHDQIISLLFTGSVNEPLSALIPTFLVNNLTALIFNSVADDAQLGRYAQALLKPVHRIHFIPNFTDQAGRGGLRATVAIDINDQWSARIQKNFNQSEDARYELQYRLSDDISVRGFKDEQRNVGGELEMRWKR